MQYCSILKKPKKALDKLKIKQQQPVRMNVNAEQDRSCEINSTSVNIQSASNINLQDSPINDSNQYGLKITSKKIPKWKKEHMSFIYNIRGVSM